MISKGHPYLKLCASTDVPGCPLCAGGGGGVAVVPLVLPQNALCDYTHIHRPFLQLVCPSHNPLHPEKRNVICDGKEIIKTHSLSI